MKRLLFIYFLLFVRVNFCSAQNDTVLNLKEVTVNSTHIKFTTGLRQLDFDSTLLINYQHHSLSELLEENSAVYLKNYGPGELSTISLRGGSAFHTAILWNGFSLSNPMHGQSDLSLVKNFLFDDISIQYGGSSFVWGSGAISGSLLLNSKPFFNSGLHILTGLTAGSFSSFTQLAGISWGNKRFYSDIKILNQNNKNNFNYYDENTSSEIKQTNSKLNQTEIMNENFYRTGKFSILNLRIWLTNSNRQIPPSTQQVNSNATQKDIYTRLSTEWKLQKNNYEYILKSAYFIESLNYNDDFITQPSNNKCKSFITESTIEKTFLSRHSFQLGINNNYSIADSSTNINNVSVNRTALFLLYRYRSISEKIDFSFCGRKEFSSLINSTPVIISGGINYNPLNSIQLRLAASKVYRNPTLNDLYWTPGGNPDLKPENGYSCEAGIQFEQKVLTDPKNKFSESQLVAGATIYQKQINDWIIWYPISNSIWAPQNLLMVRSHGIELNFKYHFRKNNIDAGIESEYFYTISTNEKSVFAYDASLHCQLIYVPIHRWNSTIYFNYKSAGIRYNHSYTGIRYTSSDNLSLLPAYTIDNIEANKSFNIKTNYLRIFIRVNNLFNTDYQCILNRPMPLRSFETGITFTFINNKSKN